MNVPIFDNFDISTDIHVPRHGDISSSKNRYRNRSCTTNIVLKGMQNSIYTIFFVVPLIAQLSRNLWHLALPLIFDANTPHQVMPEIQN